MTYNAYANVETYPMPQIEDMHSALRECTVFSVLDIKQAYHQIPIAQKSQGDLTINTHRIIYIKETGKWHSLGPSYLPE